MSFIESIKQRAKQNIKTIILPEAEDKRVLEAASKVIAQGFAKVILIGNKEQVEKDSKENNIDLSGVEIIDIKSSTKKQEYAQKLFELRQAKGMTKEEVIDSSNMVIEGIRAIEAGHQIAKKYNLDLPIIETAYNVLYKGQDVKEGISLLMNRDLKNE